MIERLVFCSLAAVTLLSALGVVLLRNTLHAALLLGLCLAGVAGVFASLGADFVFASQILIYVGGVAVLILFVVLLAGRSSDLVMRQTNRQWAAALGVCAASLWGLCRAFAPFKGLAPPGPPRPGTGELGRLLLGDLAVPFELISLVLLAALAGAVVFSRPDQGAKEGEG